MIAIGYLKAQPGSNNTMLGYTIDNHMAFVYLFSRIKAGLKAAYKVGLMSWILPCEISNVQHSTYFSMQMMFCPECQELMLSANDELHEIP